jgi:hypothetical protein
MKISSERSPIEALAARINTLRSRYLRAQELGDAGLKRVIEEELAEARKQYEQLGRVGDSILDAALISPNNPAHRTKRGLV